MQETVNIQELKSEIQDLIRKSDIAESVRENLMKEIQPLKKQIDETIDKDSELYGLTKLYWDDQSDDNKNSLLTFIAERVEEIRNV